MNIKSIYEEHYLGMTYRTGVAYLRARSRQSDKPPLGLERLTLDEQRHIIAQAARKRETLIVAEFIDYGPRDMAREALQAALAFAETTHIPDLIAVDRDWISKRSERGYWSTYSTHSGVELVEAAEE